ncbi:MAG TPA: Hsp20/alpha crystallin family protein [bacterium]|jgi:HSP20 family protein
MIVFTFSINSGRFEITGVKGESKSTRGYFKPKVDIAFAEGSFHVKMDLPGARPENIRIEANENEMNITGEVVRDYPCGPCRLMERSAGNFLRTIGFPCRIDPERITATLMDGVLSVEVPSPEAQRDPTRIEIPIREPR